MIPIKNFRISAAAFDFDGTLTTPGTLDFVAIRKALNCPLDQPVLEFLTRLPKGVKQARAFAILEQFEIAAAKMTRPNHGAERLIRRLQITQRPLAIITRNSRRAVQKSFENFEQLKMDDFAFIITRDDPIQPKPSGDAILHIAQKLDIPAHEILIVGDYQFDIQAGMKAKAVTVLLNSRDKARQWNISPDFIIQSLEDLPEIVRLEQRLTAPLEN